VRGLVAQVPHGGVPQDLDMPLTGMSAVVHLNHKITHVNYKKNQTLE